VLRQRTRWARLLSRRSRVEGIAQTRREIGRRKRRVVGLNALGAEKGVSPVRAVDVGTVGDGGLGEGTSCDGGGAVFAGKC
jgi:hypothetical protein